MMQRCSVLLFAATTALRWADKPCPRTGVVARHPLNPNRVALTLPFAAIALAPIVKNHPFGPRISLETGESSSNLLAVKRPRGVKPNSFIS